MRVPMRMIYKLSCAQLPSDLVSTINSIYGIKERVGENRKEAVKDMPHGEFQIKCKLNSIVPDKQKRERIKQEVLAVHQLTELGYFFEAPYSRCASSYTCHYVSMRLNH